MSSSPYMKVLEKRRVAKNAKGFLNINERRN